MTLRIAGVYVEALPLHYDHARWLREFHHNWPPGSAADLSYSCRIAQGPAFSLHEAYGRATAAQDG
jgi:hypothetical protein